MNFVYVVMWESWNATDGSCTGGDLYMSLDEDRANGVRDKIALSEDKFTYTWDEDNEMWINRSKYAWDKIYVVANELDTEL